MAIRTGRIIAVALACAMIVGMAPGNALGRATNNWGFEDGTLAGWDVVSGTGSVSALGADTFTAPYWGSRMAVLGHPYMRVRPTGAGTYATSPATRPFVPMPVVQQDVLRREFTATMRHLVFAYNVFQLRYGVLGAPGTGSLTVYPSREDYCAAFSVDIRLLDGTSVYSLRWQSCMEPAAVAAPMGVTLVPNTGWRVVDVDLSRYPYQQMTIEVAVENAVPVDSIDRGILTPSIPLGSVWAYFDVNDDMAPVVTPDTMPEVHFVVPADSAAAIAGSSLDVVVEASDDRAVADVRLLVNGVVVGQSATGGRQTFHVSLQEGLNTLETVATDNTGNQANAVTTVRSDTRGPVVLLEGPIPERTTNKTLALSGTVADAGSGVRSLTVNGEPIAIDPVGGFEAVVKLTGGRNGIVFEAVDGVGNMTSQTFTVTGSVPATGTLSSVYVVLTIGSADMEVNGMIRKLDAAPFIKDGRTLLPIRALIEALGGTVQWDATTKTATVVLGSRTVALTVGSTTALVNGSPVTLDVAPVIVKGRTFLPLRAVAENVGLDLAWEPVSRTVSLTYWP